MSTLPKYMTDLALNPQEAEYLRLMHDVHHSGEVKTDRTGTGTKSQFGKMMRFNLQEGIPILTTKKIHLRSIIHENLWFLSGDTNIKYLKDNGVTIWDEWADENGDLGPVYGAQWRRWEDTKMLSMETDRAKIEKLIAQGYGVIAQFPSNFAYEGNTSAAGVTVVLKKEYDQITDALNAIKNNPDSRRIIVNAWNVADVAGMALPPCHAMYQFYVSTMSNNERLALLHKQAPDDLQMDLRGFGGEILAAKLDARGIPRKKLSCMLYQRSIH